ncbi:MAG: hypothetical protein COU22_03070 [Candidatus Komeilibacteria bacterium CG10_big_fil_rev_8_21_14_0_10_41_13]|uniref:Uncharacterized protein n=1 Tax=Candidatus Komeilibacteria bacterium CG10_big_fil_rev_8_21_14_0_10_41_13 TaxID=1974476 RepID=A0A2M6WBY1_9BACT|nr:MAG: hypothetical protein COU22_03070 [Candidatus Komeilibacteria bacterium CG10_big_fil_rev_8_21_14_0_10_41_13]
MKKIISRIKLLFKSRFLARRLQAKFVIAAQSDQGLETVVDLGAGEAPYQKFFKAEKYICIDVENRKGTADVIIADVNQGIPIGDNQADVVLCIEVLEHLREPAFVIQEIHRILKPGGRLVLSTPMVWQVHEPPNDFFRYTEFGLKHLLEKAGFKKYEIKPSNNYFYTLCQLINMKLRNKFFLPLVFLLNVLALLSFNQRQNSLPIDNHLIAYKDEN